MRKMILSFAALIFSTGAAYASPKPVDQVDLQKYIGRWYQLAAIPASFQKDCVANTIAEYSPASNNRIRVLNSCMTKDGTIQKANGRARVNPDYDHPAKLEVTFVKLYKWLWAFAGDYWIIDLGSDYEYAVIGHPEYDYGWVLSRTPSLSTSKLRTIERNLKAQGYNTCDFVMSVTDEQKPKADARLCDI